MSDHSASCCIGVLPDNQPHPDCPGFYALLAAMAPRTVTITIPASKEQS